MNPITKTYRTLAAAVGLFAATVSAGWAFDLNAFDIRLSEIQLDLGPVITTVPVPPAPVFPNDTAFNRMWGLHNTGTAVTHTNGNPFFPTNDVDIDAPEAWAFHTGSSKTVVAVLDTGVDYTHPDIYKNIWLNQGEIPTVIFSRLVDVDGDGLITFWDLNEPVNQGDGKITDNNQNGYIDGGDLLFAVNCVVVLSDPIPPKDIDGDGVPEDEEPDNLDPHAELDCSRQGWADGTDNDGNGYPDDLIGWDFYNNDNSPHDNKFHGTHVAGTIGAEGNNNAGVTGVNWRVQIMPLRMWLCGQPWCNGEGLRGISFREVRYALGVMKNAGKAIRYAVDNGARVSNHSWGFSLSYLEDVLFHWGDQLNLVEGEAALTDAIAYARDRGHIVVAAAGNEATSDPHYPAAYGFANILSVANLLFDDRLDDSSNFGLPHVDLAAPGRWIHSTTPLILTEAMVNNNPPILVDFDMLTGTSMASPHVAGVAALVWDNNPEWTYQQVIAQILDNVEPVAALDGQVATGGRLNALRAIAPGARITATALLTTSGVSSDTDFSDSCASLPEIRGVRLSFNEAIDPNTFNAADVTQFTVEVNQSGLTSSYNPNVTGVEAVSGSGNRQFDILFLPIAAPSPVGSVSASLTIGPYIADLDGDNLDLDRDGADGELGDDRHTVSFTLTRTLINDSLLDCYDLQETLLGNVSVFEFEAIDLTDTFVDSTVIDTEVFVDPSDTLLSGTLIDSGLTTDLTGTTVSGSAGTLSGSTSVTSTTTFSSGSTVFGGSFTLR